MISETNRIECKQELTKEVDIEKEVIAFLNYREGGVIYIGIDRKGKVIGVEDVDGDMLKLKDRIKNNILPSGLGLFDIVAEEREGKNLIKIIVAAGSEKPYFKKKYGMTEKGAFIRSGTAAEPMPQRMIDELFAKRTRNSINIIKSNRQELSFEQLKIYYEERGTPLNKNFAVNLELLTNDKAFNYLAYLMADENGNSIKLAKYNGNNRVDLIENQEYGYCSLIKATNSILDKLEVENTTRTKITSKERMSQRFWDPVALKEAVLNAIIHNDYTSEVPQKFEIFDDRIEIITTGGLPNGLSKEDFFGGYSVPRNKGIMRIYKDLELVEQLGSGVPRILETYGKNCFKFSNNFILMTFPKSVNRAIEGRKVKQTNYQIQLEGVRRKFGEKFGGSSGKIIVLIMKNENITISEMAEIIDISTRAVEKQLAKLKTIGVIDRVGPDKGGFWKVNL